MPRVTEKLRSLNDKDRIQVFGMVALMGLLLYLISKYSRGDEIKPLATMALRDHTIGLAEGASLWLGF